MKIDITVDSFKKSCFSKKSLKLDNWIGTLQNGEQKLQYARLSGTSQAQQVFSNRSH